MSVAAARQAPALALESAQPSAVESNQLPLDKFLVIGERTMQALNAPDPVSPLPGFLDPDPVLHALTAEAKVGKTTFAAQLGVAFAAGVAPWPGAPALDGSGVLFISAEESVSRVARLHSAIAKAMGLTPDRWIERLGLIARGRLQPEDGLAALHLRVEPEELDTLFPSRSGRGFELLRELLLSGRTADGLRFRYVVLDSASRLWDVADESDNAAVSRWMNELQRLCIDAGARILVIHHQGHNKRDRATTAARGASAFGAAARVNMSLTRGDTESARLLSVEGNAIALVTHRMNIAGGAEGILGTYATALSLAEEVEHVMPLNEPASVNAVAERVLRLRGSDSRSSGALRDAIKQLLDSAVASGSVARTDNKNAGYARLSPLRGFGFDAPQCDGAAQVAGEV